MLQKALVSWSLQVTDVKTLEIKLLIPTKARIGFCELNTAWEVTSPFQPSFACKSCIWKRVYCRCSPFKATRYKANSFPPKDLSGKRLVFKLWGSRIETKRTAVFTLSVRNSLVLTLYLHAKKKQCFCTSSASCTIEQFYSRSLVLCEWETNLHGFKISSCSANSNANGNRPKWPIFWFCLLRNSNTIMLH